jgi:hypothetical protein
LPILTNKAAPIEPEMAMSWTCRIRRPLSGQYDSMEAGAKKVDVPVGVSEQGSTVSHGIDIGGQLRSDGLLGGIVCCAECFVLFRHLCWLEVGECMAVGTLLAGSYSWASSTTCVLCVLGIRDKEIARKRSFSAMLREVSPEGRGAGRGT